MARINFKETYGKRRAEEDKTSENRTRKDNFTSRMAKDLDRTAGEKTAAEEWSEKTSGTNKTDQATSVSKDSSASRKAGSASSARKEDGQKRRPAASSSAEENPIKKTSVNIKRTSLNFLAAYSRLNGLNQNDYLTQIIKEAMKKKKEPSPDLTAAKVIRHEENTVVKAIQIRESELNWLKRMAALNMRSISAYLDDLIEEKAEAVKKGADGDKKGE